MIYSSSVFLVYFLPVFLLIYIFIDKRYKNGLLLISSVLFYAWGAPKFIFILAASAIADFFLVGKMNQQGKGSRRLFYLASIFMNLGLLLYFKYMNFFVTDFNMVLGWFGAQPVKWSAVALPIGISFITFQKLSYTFDVHKGTHPPFRRFNDYALYVFMFPQLLSGPITRVGQIAGQIADRSADENTDSRITGFYRFMIGLAKKVLIADVLSVKVNEIFAMGPAELSTGMAWVGAVAFTFQIFFDFSGYTDMAIGLGRMLGFRLPENFNHPYLSTSITDFWKRWHITLSNWLRDYLFLPLAYAFSRKLPQERYFDVRADKIIYLLAAAVTFLACGFWHGAAWTFIFWGGYQGLFLILDRFFLLKFLKKAGRMPSILITFFIIVMGWVLFRAPGMHYALFYYKTMFSFVSHPTDLWLDPKFWTILSLAGIITFSGVIRRVENLKPVVYESPNTGTIMGLGLAGILLFILSLAHITSSGFNPFIYFRF